MRDYVDIIGAAGSHYRFAMRLKDGRPLSPMGGNFLFARFTGEAFEMIYAGEAQNLMNGAKERWNEAVERFQVTELYSRLNISGAGARPAGADRHRGRLRPADEHRAGA